MMFNNQDDKLFRIQAIILLISIPLSISCSDHPGCIAGNSSIHTPEGNVNIEDLRKGDLVYSFDHRIGNKSISRITAINKTKPDSYYLIETDNGGLLRSTGEHPVFSARLGRYAQVKNFAGGDQLKTILGVDTISGIWKKKNMKGDYFYDISLSGSERNYFANRILVHNKSYPAPVYITSNECNLSANMIDLEFSLRNDSSNMYDYMVFWVRFVAGNAVEIVSFDWYPSSRIFAPGDTIDLAYSISEGEFAVIHIADITDIIIAEVDLYNSIKSSDKLMTCSFYGLSSQLYP